MRNVGRIAGLAIFLQWERTFKGSAEMKKFFAAQYTDLKAVMRPLGLTK